MSVGCLAQGYCHFIPICWKRGAPASEAVRPACLSSRRESLAGWAGLGASREPNKRPPQGGGCSGQEMASWGTGLWSEAGRGGAGEVSWPCGQPGHRKVVSFLGRSCLLSTYYGPGMADQITPTLGSGAESSWQKAVVNHLGAPMSIWEPGQPEGRAAFQTEGPAGGSPPPPGSAYPSDTGSSQLWGRAPGVPQIPQPGKG